jgi:hypothetical protein
MSRSYRLEVMTKGVPIKDLARIMTARFHWEESGRGEFADIIYFTGEGCLNCGQSESEAHQAISDAIKIEHPQAHVATQWTCLTERPYTIYGDDFSAAVMIHAQYKMKGGAEMNNGQDILAGQQ